MKIITASNGIQTLKMSKKEWTDIGGKAGQIKEASTDVYLLEDFDTKNFTATLVKLPIEQAKELRKIVQLKQELTDASLEFDWVKHVQEKNHDVISEHLNKRIEEEKPINEQLEKFNNQYKPFTIPLTAEMVISFPRGSIFSERMFKQINSASHSMSN